MKLMYKKNVSDSMITELEEMGIVCLVVPTSFDVTDFFMLLIFTSPFYEDKTFLHWTKWLFKYLLRGVSWICFFFLPY